MCQVVAQRAFHCIGETQRHVRESGINDFKFRDDSFVTDNTGRRMNKELFHGSMITSGKGRKVIMIS